MFDAMGRLNSTDEADFEDTATYSIGGKQIKTATTYETTLLPTAAYLAVYDPDAFDSRKHSLPTWSDALRSLKAADLPSIVGTRSTGVSKEILARERETAAGRSPAPAPHPLPDVSHSSYSEALAVARSRNSRHRPCLCSGTFRGAQISPPNSGRRRLTGC